MMKTKRNGFQFVALCMASALVIAQPSSSSHTQTLGEQIDQTIQHITKGGYWGSALVVQNDVVLLDKGYGYADYLETPNAPETLFEIASLSKQFVAAGIYRLAMDDKLNIEDPVSRFLPQFSGEMKSITIHHLLTHTSGISANLGLPYASQATRDELVELITKEPLVASPGDEFAYFNSGYALLAAIIEVASDMSYEEYLQTHLFGPAGLEHTGFIGDQRLEQYPISSRLSKSGSELSAIRWHRGWGYRGMGGVVTNTGDLLAWHRVLLSQQVLDEDSLQQMFTPKIKNYASGWFVENTERGTTRIYHTGSVEGYSSLMIRFPDDRSAIILLSNGSTNLYRIAFAIDAVLHPLPVATLAVDLPGYDLNEFRAVVSTDKWDWNIIHQENKVIMELNTRESNATVARVALPELIAKKLTKELGQILFTKEYQSGSAATANNSDETEHGVYLFGHDSQTGLKIEGVEPSVRAQYSGIKPDGSRVVDTRTTLIFVDPTLNMWPIMSKLSTTDASKLLDDLEAAIEQLE